MCYKRLEMYENVVVQMAGVGIMKWCDIITSGQFTCKSGRKSFRNVL